MLYKSRQDSFEYRMEKRGEIELILISSFTRGNEKWSVLSSMMTAGYELKILEGPESGKTKFRGHLQLYKVSNGVEKKFAIIDTVYVDQNEFRIYVVALENMRRDAQLRLEMESRRTIGRMEMLPEEAKKIIYELLRGPK